MNDRLTIYTDEEIDMILHGDRREIDRMLLKGISNIGRILLPYISKQNEIFGASGGAESITERRLWVESQIAKSNARTEMMQKVATSSVTWALILFIGFLLASAGHSIIDAIRGTHTALPPPQK